MADLDELLDGALDDFRETAPSPQPSTTGSGSEGGAREAPAPRRSSKGFSFQFDAPSKAPSGASPSSGKGPALPPRPGRARKGASQSAAQPTSSPTSSAAAQNDPAPSRPSASSTAAAPADLTATLAALAPPGGAAGAAPDLSATLRAAAAATASSRQGQAGGPAVSHDEADSLLNELTAQLQGMGENAEDPGVMDTFVNGLLHQLLSKQVLYQSMKDIGARYPGWLDRHAASLPAVDLARYTAQHQHIVDICRLYDTDPDNFNAIYDKLQQVQAFQHVHSQMFPLINLCKRNSYLRNSFLLQNVFSHFKMYVRTYEALQ